MGVSGLRGLGVAALLIGYPLLAHYTNEPAHNPRLGALVAIAPVALIALLFAWHSSRRFVVWGALLLSGVALSAAWPALENHFGQVYWLQNMAMHLILLITFGRTLIAGRQPLCTRFAEALYGRVSVRHAMYTRQVTVAWTVFFAAMALLSALLFFFASLVLWSAFSNFLTLPLVALMFIVEYAVRKRVLPDLPPMHILDALRAFRNDAPPSG
jgi:uncharacterized membrane protein